MGGASFKLLLVVPCGIAGRLDCGGFGDIG